MWGKSAAASATRTSGSESAAEPGTDDSGVRHFTGTVMRSVLADVRTAFGPDAIILKQQSSNGRIRITACSETQLGKLTRPQDVFDADPSGSNAFETGPFRNDRSREDVFGVGPVAETRSGSIGVDPNRPTAPRSRVADVLLPTEETGIRSWWGRNRSTTPPGHARSAHADAELLADLDYSEAVVERLVSETDGSGLAERIARQLVAPRGPITADLDTGTLLPGAYRFSGPAGHGKTALIARLATAFVLAHGTEGVVLVSTDQDRLGGTLKLDRLAQLLGVDFRVIEEADIPMWCRQGNRLLLIDTDGEPSTAKRTRTSPVDVLVLSAVAQPRLLARALDAASPDCVIALTQLDQAETLGSALSVLLADEQLNRPVEWLGFGQTIDDSHGAANIANVSQWALRGVDRSANRTNFS